VCTVGILLVNGTWAVYRDEVLAANEWNLLMQFLCSPAQIPVLIFPALLPEGGGDVRESRRRIAGCVVDPAVGIVVAVNKVCVTA
jgi:hypothetical protein